MNRGTVSVTNNHLSSDCPTQQCLNSNLMYSQQCRKALSVNLYPRVCFMFHLQKMMADFVPRTKCTVKRPYYGEFEIFYEFRRMSATTVWRTTTDVASKIWWLHITMQFRDNISRVSSLVWKFTAQQESKRSSGWARCEWAWHWSFIDCWFWRIVRTYRFRFKLQLHQFITHDLFAGKPLPPPTDTLYWPTSKQILSCLYPVQQRMRSGRNDEDTVRDMIHSWTEDPEFHAHIELSLRDDSAGVVMLHQSRWQQRMLALYGQAICLLDATYKTTWYDMPLYFLCVSTNVVYVNVATMLLCDDKADSIETALWTYYTPGIQTGIQSS